ncbi:MAG TPA: sigma 54-interacting transcriptional regulator [Acidobacteriota bacterium]|nr:sigma 54-interacting transcriptional regulator [Acidobacteriota bacterium]
MQLALVADFQGTRHTFPLDPDHPEHTAGSLPDNAIYLPFKGVSRRHFAVVYEMAAWHIRDLDSRNGIRVNGKKVHQCALHRGDIVQVGIVRLEVQEQAEVEALSLDTQSKSPLEEATDSLGVVPIAEQEPKFFFPELVLPEGMILGNSPAMFELYKNIHNVAKSDMNVLLVGETGVGKEMIAETLHLSSKRAGHPFVAVNCAAIPAELAEAELFGIGAKVATDVTQRKGKIAAAHHGTLFLDEISSFPMPLQAKVLRAIQDRRIYAVGEHEPQDVDFRLVAATNEDPQQLIESGRMRKDLYHRLSTMEIHIPPLRERKEDLEVLILGILRQILKKEGKQLAGISKNFLALLLKYSYPGNVRELYNILASVVAMARPGQVLDVNLAPEKLRKSRRDELLEELIEPHLRKDSLPIKETMDEIAGRLVLYALKLHGGNLARTAKYLDISAFGLRKMMKRLRIRRPEKGADQDL